MSKLSKEKKKTCIAITGSMASGKSTVMKYLKDKGKEVADCDKINAFLLEKGNDGYLQVVSHFGNDLLVNGDIDKKKLADLVFSDRNKREQLEAIMHPLILEEIRKLQKQHDELYVEVPLLFETGWEAYFDENWLVVSDLKELYQRCFEKRGMRDDLISERLHAQMPIEEKIKKANIVIENNASLDELYKKIDGLLERSYYE